MEAPIPKLVGIAGGTGTGKTTLARIVADHVGRERVTLLHQDHYYRDRSDLPPARRDALNFDYPDAIEFDLLIEHLCALRAGRSVLRPTYDFGTHTRTGATIRLEPAPLLLVEGILILHPPQLRELFDLALYLHTDPAVMLSRRAQRDVVHRSRPADGADAKPFEQHVLPMHTQFVEPTRRFADVVLDTTKPTPEAVHRAIERIQALLA